MNIYKIICEEYQKFHEAYGDDWYGDDEELSLADRMYQQKFGINTEPKQQQGSKSQFDDSQFTKGTLFGFVQDQATRKLQNPVAIYLNPKSLQGFSKDCRGILFADMDFFLAANEQALHYNMLDELSKEGIVPNDTKDNYFSTYPRDFIAVERLGGTNTFTQSAAYDEFPDYYVQIMNKASKSKPYRFKVQQHA